MCAWRIVQPAIFENIYIVTRGLQRLLIPIPVRERKFNNTYRWWNTRRLINHTEEGYTLQGDDRLPYYPGRYLRNTQILLHILSLAVYSVWLISYSSVYPYARDIILDALGNISFISFLFPLTYWTIFIYISSYLVLLIIRHRSRRKILENGLLSIQSSAVVWRLVALAHLSAVKEGYKGGKDYQGYSRRLAVNARIIRDNLFDIHKVIMKKGL